MEGISNHFNHLKNLLKKKKKKKPADHLVVVNPGHMVASVNVAEKEHRKPIPALNASV